MDTAVLRDLVIHKAKDFGADDAGVCLASELLNGPTHRKFPRPNGIKDHHCLIVFALSHPASEPALDYYIKNDGARFGNSKGNRLLMDISDGIGVWLCDEGIGSRDLHYYVEWGGVFLKGAAVLAGLGTIGVNNMLIHPGYGPRIRLRAHLVEAALTPSIPLDFDPCSGCQQPCLDACPENAFDQTGYVSGRRQICLDRNATEAVVLPADDERPSSRKSHCCRICELSCSYTGTLET